MQLEALAKKEWEQPGFPSIADLCALAVDGLAKMYEPEQQLFCNIYARTDRGMQRQGLSPRYTMMTLLGLHRYQRAGGQSPIAIAPVLRRMMKDTGWITGAGDLGLLLWTCAELLPEETATLYHQLRASDALAHYEDAKQGFTMETAWYLTGLVGCCEAGRGDLPGLHEAIMGARAILARNCGEAGIYGHRNNDGGITGYARKRIGSFADQVYPTIAFARLSKALSDRDARDRAIRTAVTMCDLQGSMGEWSWHYDAQTGRVINRYPVYSVHQHGMGPMMLQAISDSCCCDFQDALARSLAWISGANELKQDFVEPELGLIWRSVYLTSFDKYADAGLRLLRLRQEQSGAKMKIRYECRPYELGWLLYAWAGR